MSLTAPALSAAVMAKKPVPVNTLINADNVNEFFSVAEVKAAPQGAVTNLDDLKGKFIVKPLNEGQWVFKSATDGKAVDLAMADPVAVARSRDGRATRCRCRNRRAEQMKIVSFPLQY